jgi:hypothetical protein
MYKKIFDDNITENFDNNKLQNTRNENCSMNDMTVCCPHMSINEKGEYSGTNEMTPFLYKGRTYELHTCCKVCAKAMIDYGDDMFEKIHKPIIYDDHMIIHHKDTGVVIQKMKIIQKEQQYKKPEQQYKKPEQQYKKPEQQYKKPEQQYKKHSVDNKYNEMKGSNELMWEFSQPTTVYNDMVDRFGLPDTLAPQRGGIAIWNSIIGHHDKFYDVKNVFDKIELRDELVAHACPAQHNDFLYSYIKIPILPKQLEDVNKLSGSVNYDMLKKELFARCSSTCANVMTLYLATEIILSHLEPDNHYNIQKIHDEKMYVEHINKSGDSVFIKGIYNKLANNIEKIKKKQSLPKDYWTGAFGENCKKPN